MTMSNMERKRNELYEDISVHIVDVMTDYNVNTDVAEQVAAAIIHRLSEHWGGSVFSFPKDMAYRVSKRNLIIWRKFTGNNHRQLALEFGISENAVYQIIKDIRKQIIQKNQPDLF